MKCVCPTFTEIHQSLTNHVLYIPEKHFCLQDKRPDGKLGIRGTVAVVNILQNLRCPFLH
jgi:hypothetical protein